MAEKATEKAFLSQNGAYHMCMEPGNIITLAPITDYGDYIIHKHGDKWHVLSIGKASSNSPFEEGAKIIHLAPVATPDKHWQIIRAENDKNFELVFTD